MANLSFRADTSQLMRRLNSMRAGFAESSEGEELVKKSSAAGMRVAIQEAPRGETGNLKKAIQLKPLTRSGGTLEGGFDVNIRYGAPQNFGFIHNRSGRFIEGKFFMEQGYVVTAEYAKRNLQASIRKFMARG